MACVNVVFAGLHDFHISEKSTNISCHVPRLNFQALI